MDNVNIGRNGALTLGDRFLKRLVIKPQNLHMLRNMIR
jgi:hypothetical protein